MIKANELPVLTYDHQVGVVIIKSVQNSHDYNKRNNKKLQKIKTKIKIKQGKSAEDKQLMLTRFSKFSNRIVRVSVP